MSIIYNVHVFIHVYVLYHRQCACVKKKEFKKERNWPKDIRPPFPWPLAEKWWDGNETRRLANLSPQALCALV